VANDGTPEAGVLRLCAVLQAVLAEAVR